MKNTYYSQQSAVIAHQYGFTSSQQENKLLFRPTFLRNKFILVALKGNETVLSAYSSSASLSVSLFFQN